MEGREENKLRKGDGGRSQPTRQSDEPRVKTAADLVNIFAKKRKVKALMRWRKRNAPRNVSQTKGKGRAM